MIKLKQLLELNQSTTLLDLYVRQPDGRLIKRSVVGTGYGSLSMYEDHDLNTGKLELIDESINIHGKVNKKGMSEICYGMIWKAIPKDYLDAEVTDVSSWRERYGNRDGNVLHATIVPVQMTMDCAWK